MPSSTSSRSSSQHQRQYENLNGIPYSYDKRNCTDICCTVIGIAFTVAMILFCLIGYNSDHYAKASNPADSQGRICGVDLPAYPYIYLGSVDSLNPRFCVSKCPSEDDYSLDTEPLSTSGGFIKGPVTYYPATASMTRNGPFCIPDNEQDKAKFEQTTKLDERNVFLNSLDTLMLSVYISLVVSIIYAILLQCFPKGTSNLAVFLGIAALVLLIIGVIIYKSDQIMVKVILVICLVILLVILIVNALFNRDSWRMFGVFLDHSTKFISKNCLNVVYVPVFLLILVLFCMMMIWEFKCIWASGQPIFKKEESLYYSFEGSGAAILTILLAIQGLWGLSFIKEAFNFLISGHCANFYFNKDEGCFSPLKYLFCKHFGSVVGGSYMTAFFSFFDFVFDVIKPDRNDVDQNGQEKSSSKCFYSVCCCASVFDLVRSDAMAYIYLTGNAYCNSAKAVEYLCGNSSIMNKSQSCSRSYRIASHLMISALTLIISFAVMGTVSLYVGGIMLIMNLFIATFFIALHADAAEALQVIYVTDEELNTRVNSKDYNQKEQFGGNADHKFEPTVKTDEAKELNEDVQKQRSEQREKEIKKRKQREQKNARRQQANQSTSNA